MSVNAVVVTVAATPTTTKMIRKHLCLRTMIHDVNDMHQQLAGASVTLEVSFVGGEEFWLVGRGGSVAMSGSLIKKWGVASSPSTPTAMSGDPKKLGDGNRWWRYP